MKRKDAFRKIRTICERLDQVDPLEFWIEPQRLYLFGSVLTDRPDPADVDLILVYENASTYDVGQDVAAMTYGRPMAIERLVIHLRRRMQMIRIAPARGGLENWQNRGFLLEIRPQLIWEPGGNWRPVLDKIEVSPLPWSGPRPEDANQQFEAFIKSLPEEEYQTRLTQALAEVESQRL
jgi:hypothetical protein